MLKIIVQKNGKVETWIEGDIPEITAETMAAVRSIYEGILKENEEAATEFKNHILEDIDLSFTNKDELENNIIRRMINELEGMIKEELGE